MLTLAYKENRVLITADKDFGELVFLHRRPHPCIVRLVELRVTEEVDAMQDLIERHDDAMCNGAIIVVTKKQAGIRPAGSGRRSDN